MSEVIKREVNRRTIVNAIRAMRVRMHALSASLPPGGITNCPADQKAAYEECLQLQWDMDHMASMLGYPNSDHMSAEDQFPTYIPRA